jgi:hypothetical protein
VREKDLLAQASRAARCSFLLGVKSSGREAADGELDIVISWAKRTVERYLLLDDILAGRSVLELVGNQVGGCEPNKNDAMVLRAWQSQELGRRRRDG